MKLSLFVPLVMTLLSGCASERGRVGAPAALTTAVMPARGPTGAPDHPLHWPDGHVAAGGDAFEEMFAFAPDAHVVGEPTRSESGEWATLVRVVSGTFRAPRAAAAGESVAPTGKPFTIWFATVSHRGHGSVDDEYVFWSERTLRSQIER